MMKKRGLGSTASRQGLLRYRTLNVERRLSSRARRSPKDITDISGRSLKQRCAWRERLTPSRIGVARLHQTLQSSLSLNVLTSQAHEKLVRMIDQSRNLNLIIGSRAYDAIMGSTRFGALYTSNTFSHRHGKGLLFYLDRRQKYICIHLLTSFLSSIHLN